MKVAIVGGSGFLGSHIIKKLSDAGSFEVFVLARTSETLPDGVTFIKASVTDRGSLEAAFERMGRVDVVFHLAGIVEHSRRNPKPMYDVHVKGTMNVLEVAKRSGVRRVIYSSTSGTVGCFHSESEIATDDSLYCKEITKDWPYYASKIEAEEQALAFYKANLTPELIVMRPSLILGPGDDRFSSVTLVHEFLKRNIPILPPGGLSLVDVRDTADAFITAMEKGVPGSTYLLGSANLTHRQFYKSLEGVTGVRGPTLQVPMGILLFLLRLLYFFTWRLFGIWLKEKDPAFVEMGAVFWGISSKRAEADLGFKPIPYLDTLRDTVRWLKERNRY